MNRFVKTSKVKYVLYARKSTDESGKQDKSIDDQISYCKDLARNLQLDVVETLVEKMSAKKSKTRPIFNEMIKNIKNKKYTGILAWHPDRLARNMGDGGLIIDLVDEGVIKDLKFCTQQFSRDANGKMLLGLSFVLSKQYSDKLSDDVTRGNRKRHLEGRTLGRPKYGYDDKDGRYVKGKFWGLIKQAWQMRLQGMTEKKVCDWLNEEGFYREVKSPSKQNKRSLMTTSKINVMFKDTFYFGEMTLNGDTVNLNDIEGYGFEPVVTKEQFYAVQSLPSKRGSYKKSSLYLSNHIFDANIQGLAYKPSKIRNKSGNHYLYYQVDNKHKLKYPPEVRKKLKAIRAKLILEYFEKLLSNFDVSKFSKKDFDHYIKETQSYIQHQRDSKETERRRLTGMINRLQNERDQLIDNFIKHRDSYDELEITNYEKAKNNINAKIRSLKNDLSTEVANIDNEDITIEKFLNTLKLLSESYKTMDGHDKMKLAEMLILNTYVHNGKVVGMQLKQPFDLVFPEKILDGRAIRI